MTRVYIDICIEAPTITIAEVDWSIPPLMDAEEVLKLFDSCWFQLEIFKLQPSPWSCQANADQEILEEPSKPVISGSQTMHSRSMSDQLSSLTSFNPGSFSPDTVLVPKLQTILSEKEITEGDEDSTGTKSGRALPKRAALAGGRRRKKGVSKSLSELEFDEVKGFMDLGFVFSEEDKDSILAEVIPGLHRLGMKDGEDDNKINESTVVRPYLSEAWKVSDRKKKGDSLMNWRIPALSSEIDMKDNLRSWAHKVASSVI